MTDGFTDGRRYKSTTSASAHPELLVGEFVTRPHFRPLLTPDDRISITRWWLLMGSAAVMLVAAFVGWLSLAPQRLENVACANDHTVGRGVAEAAEATPVRPIECAPTLAQARPRVAESD